MTASLNKIRILFVKTFSLLGVKLSGLKKAHILNTLEALLEGKDFSHLATVNPEFLVEAHKNSKFKHL